MNQDAISIALAVHDEIGCDLGGVLSPTTIQKEHENEMNSMKYDTETQRHIHAAALDIDTIDIAIATRVGLHEFYGNACVFGVVLNEKKVEYDRDNIFEGGNDDCNVSLYYFKYKRKSTKCIVDAFSLLCLSFSAILTNDNLYLVVAIATLPQCVSVNIV